MRFLHKIYADIFGYFWLPCPICREMFGGHEKRGKPSLRKTSNTGVGVCKNCGPESRRRNIELMKSDKGRLWTWVDGHHI